MISRSAEFLLGFVLY